MTKTANNYRHEFKHYINSFEAVELRQKLRAIMKTDSNARADGRYLVTSLYFDNYSDKALREKLDGVNHREKFRLRTYNNNFNLIRLEKKSKHRGLCKKDSCIITTEQCNNLIDNKQYFSQSNPMLLNELIVKMNYELLRPKVIVAYEREAFVEKTGNVRVTIDSSLASNYNAADFLKETPANFTLQNFIILEVKYDAFIPAFIENIVQIKNRQNTAFSKYAAARIVY